VSPPIARPLTPGYTFYLHVKKYYMYLYMYTAYVWKNPDQERTNQNARIYLETTCNNCNDCNYILCFLTQALKFHIACDMTAQEVHDLGQNEVRRIRSRMDKVKK